MSEYADKHSKAHRKERVEHILAVDPKAKIDASGYTPPDALDTEKKTGPEQPKPRKYKRGGMVEGHKAHHHAGRAKRDAGGMTAVQQLRPQVPTSGLYGAGFSPTHAGMEASAAGIKKGGAVKKHKAKGGDVTGVRITGDRKARAEGGRAKGKTNINIIIGGPKEAPQGGMAPPPPPSAIPPKPPLPPGAMGAMQPPGMGGPGMATGAPAGGSMPPQMPPMPPR